MNKLVKALTFSFSKNLGRTERIIRVAIALAAIGAWYFGYVAGTMAVIAGIVAIAFLGTAATASYPLHYIAGINSMSSKEKKEMKNKGIAIEE